MDQLLTKELHVDGSIATAHEPPLDQTAAYQFYFPSERDIVQQSVLEIRDPNDVDSKKLGIMDVEKSCLTCDAVKLSNCPGHPAHMFLNIPTFRVYGIRILARMLNCFCFYCQKLRLPKSDPKYEYIAQQPPDKRLELLEAACRVNYKVCTMEVEMEGKVHASALFENGCGRPYIHWRIEEKRDNLFIRPIVPLSKTDYQAYIANPMNWKPFACGPSEIYQVLTLLSDEVKEMMGCVPAWDSLHKETVFLNDPTSYMWKALEIPSLNTRPQQSIRSLGSQCKNMFNGWTRYIKNIVLTNIELEKCMQAELTPVPASVPASSSVPIASTPPPISKSSHRLIHSLHESIRHDHIRSLVSNPLSGLPWINLCQYSYAGVISNDFRAAFELGSCTDKDERKTAAKRIKTDESKLDGRSPVEIKWRELTRMIAAFHSLKHKKYANKQQKSEAGAKFKSNYFKAPQNVPDRYHGQKLGNRFRINVDARRINYTVRAVLESSIDIRLNQAGMPSVVATRLTVKTYVNRYNHAELLQLVINGPNVYPGANYVMLKTGTEIDLGHVENRRDIAMEEVLFVRRHVRDGDPVIVNRQPTLHRPSMLSLRVKIMEGYVIRIHPANFLPLGADCDGDEVNIYCPQEDAARAEVATLGLSQEFILKDGKPWIRFEKNPLLGAYYMTMKDTFFTRDEMSLLIQSIEDVYEFPQPAIVKPVELWTGKQIVDALFPSQFNFSCKSTPGLVAPGSKNSDAKLIEQSADKPSLKTTVPEDDEVCIHRGHILSGVIRQHDWNSAKGIIATMYRDIGHAETQEFLYQGYQLFQKALALFGHSAGFYDSAMDDRWISEDTDQQLKTIQQRAEVIYNYADSFQNYTPATAMASVESCLRSHTDVLSKMSRDITVSHHMSIPQWWKNGIMAGIDSGGMGSDKMLNQMCGPCGIGQIFVLYRRYANQSSHFLKGRRTLNAHGFAMGNYADGVDETTMISESHSTAESVTMKKRGTAKSGYNTRRMVMCLMGTVVNETGQVLNARGKQLWSKYGNDGYDPQQLVSNTSSSIFLSDHELLRFFKGTQERELAVPLVRHIQNGLIKSMANPDDIVVKLPVDMNHLIKQVEQLIPANLDPNPDELEECRDYIWDGLVSLGFISEQNVGFELIYREKLRLHHLMSKGYGFSHLLWIGDKIRQACMDCRIHRGESVGTNSTQSTGEVYTQQSLKTTHGAGQLLGVVSGTAALAALIEGSESNSSMSIMCKAGISEHQAITYGMSLVRLTVGDVAKSWTHTLKSGELVVTVILDKSRCIQHRVTPSQIVQNVAKTMQYTVPKGKGQKSQKPLKLHLTLDLFQVSYADEEEWSFTLTLPRYHRYWTTITSKTTLAASVPTILYNLLHVYRIHGLPEISGFHIDSIPVYVKPVGSKNKKNKDDKDGVEIRVRLTTIGSSLAHALTLDWVDPIRTVSTNSYQMQAVLGLFAARKHLESQYLNVMKDISDPRHIQLIARAQFSDLDFKGMTITGLGQNIPPLQRAAYEKCIDQLVTSCIRADRDYCSTITGANLANHRVGVGTGYQMYTKPLDRIKPVYPALEPNRHMSTYVCRTRWDESTRTVMEWSTWCKLGQEITRPILALWNKRGFPFMIKHSLSMSRLFQGTVLDGYMSQDRVFTIVDIYMIYGQKCTELRYDQRLEICKGLLINDLMSLVSFPIKFALVSISSIDEFSQSGHVLVDMSASAPVVSYSLPVPVPCRATFQIFKKAQAVMNPRNKSAQYRAQGWTALQYLVGKMWSYGMSMEHADKYRYDVMDPLQTVPALKREVVEVKEGEEEKEKDYLYAYLPLPRFKNVSVQQCLWSHVLGSESMNPASPLFVDGGYYVCEWDREKRAWVILTYGQAQECNLEHVVSSLQREHRQLLEQDVRACVKSNSV